MAEQFNCPACQSVISTDGRALVKRSPSLVKLEADAADAEKLERDLEKALDKVELLEKREKLAKPAAAVPARPAPAKRGRPAAAAQPAPAAARREEREKSVGESIWGDRE